MKLRYKFYALAIYAVVTSAAVLTHGHSVAGTAMVKAEAIVVTAPM